MTEPAPDALDVASTLDNHEATTPEQHALTQRLRDSLPPFVASHDAPQGSSCFLPKFMIISFEIA